MTLSEKIDKVLDAIKLGKDATEVTDCCKPLTKKVELLQVILKLAALVQSAPKEEKVVSEKLDENVALIANADADADADDDANDDANADAALKLKEAEEIEAQEVATKKVAEDRGATVVIVDENAATAVQSTVVVKRLWSKPSYLSVVKSGFDNKTKQTIVTPTEKICRKLMDTGACEDKKNCQHLHPVKCSYYAGFGLARINPNGCKSADCKFLHVVICRYKYKALCKKQLCSLQHLQPKAVEKKAKVQPEIQPKKAPTTAAFLDQSLDLRMSRIEGLLMMMIPSQKRLSGLPHGILEGAYSKN
jgi:hypothetical protein